MHETNKHGVFEHPDTKYIKLPPNGELNLFAAQEATGIWHWAYRATIGTAGASYLPSKNRHWQEPAPTRRDAWIRAAEVALGWMKDHEGRHVTTQRITPTQIHLVRQILADLHQPNLL